uniref:SHOCT-like domain-containing protein n=1 Tax=Aggregatilinea sp. TaxID=2806333 RepID=UPI002C90265A
MADERLQILKMLQEGKIDAEGAERLLRALAASDPVEQAAPDADDDYRGTGWRPRHPGRPLGP